MDKGPLPLLSANSHEAQAVAERGGSRSKTTSSVSRSYLVDRAYREYCELKDAGDSVDPDVYCARFPGIESSLARLLQAHRFLEEYPELTEDEIVWPSVGESFLDYQLVADLGQGAFARVFLAEEAKIGNRLVAVKITCRGGADEADILGRVNHPNIVPVFSIQHDDVTELSAVCMPYLGSATLHDVLDRLNNQTDKPKSARHFLDAARELPHPVTASGSPAPPRILQRGTYLDAVRWVGMQLADALAHIHERGICHLDLKPSNVLLSPQGTPMLLDFNLSSSMRRDPQRQGGTLPYMSPEQLQLLLKRGTADAVQANSDLFSLGVILYQLATGEHPFGPIPLQGATEELAAQLLDRQHAGFKPVRSLNQDIDPAFAQWIERCLAFDPAERAKSAAELASALRQQLKPIARTRRWIGRNPKKVLVGVAIFLAMILTAAAAVASRPSASERHYAAGKEAYLEGRYQDAVHRFNAAVDADSEMVKAYVGRGRAYLKLGREDKSKFSLAASDFEHAHEFDPRGEYQAAAGYAANCLGFHLLAVGVYKKAIDAGFDSPEVLNNMGYSLRTKKNSEKEAIDYLTEAIKRNNQLQAAYFNRANLHSTKAANTAQRLDYVNRNPNVTATKPEWNPKSLSVELADALNTGHHDFEEALRLGPLSGELLVNAACFFTVDCENQHAWKARAIDLLTFGVRQHDVDPGALASNPRLKALQDDERFQQLLRSPRPTRKMTMAESFVDPLKNFAP